MSESTAIVESSPVTALSFGDTKSFEHIMRVATMFSKSTLVPKAFQNDVANCTIAMELAQRMSASPLMVMQNIDIIYGRPSFRSTFNIAAVNSCGRFTPLRFVFVGETGKPSWGCYAVAKAKADGMECKGTTVTMDIADKEGWIKKDGSKWKTMPELMLHYRAATWWTRMYAPEILMGFPVQDELEDIPVKAEPVAADPTAPATAAPVTVVADAPKESTRRRSDKGLAAMKVAEKTVTPPPVEEKKEDTTTTPAPAETPAAETKTEEKKADTPPPAEEKKADPAPATPPPAPTTPAAPKIRKARLEIIDVQEKTVAKQGGPGPVCTVQVKGDFAGTAYFDGPMSKLPANGAIIEAELEEKMHKNVPTQIIKSFTSLA